MKTLKIQPKYREYRNRKYHVPEIRFSGIWLQRLGFNYGKQVHVYFEKGKLVLKAGKP